MPGILFISANFACADENLLENGSFEKGSKTPENWEAANGLTSFYLEEEGRGRILKLDTRVDRKQALARMKDFKENPEAPPPEPIFPKDGLVTIASNEGAWVDSEFIAAKPGQNYRLSVDYKGQGGAFVWIKGFMYHPGRKDYADAYQTRLHPKSSDPGKWKNYSIGFNPTEKTPKVEKFKVRIYAYWPPGVFFFDNLKVEEITQDEMAELVRARDDSKDVKPAGD